VGWFLCLRDWATAPRICVAKIKNGPAKSTGPQPEILF
jgi:hypothetical protein